MPDPCYLPMVVKRRCVLDTAQQRSFEGSPQYGYPGAAGASGSGAGGDDPKRHRGSGGLAPRDSG